MRRSVWVSAAMLADRVSVVCRVGMVVAVLAVLSTACNKPNAADATAAAAGRGRGSAAVPVLTATAVQKDVPQLIQTIGNVEAYSTVEVRPQVSGTLLKVSFAEGQDVQAGQLLFTIDPQPFDLAVRQAEAQLAKDTAQADNAEAIRARNEDLLKRGILAPADYQTSASQAASLRATLKADQTAIESAKLQLQYTKIVAPVSGRTGALMVHEGSLLRSSDTSAMVVINQVTPIRVVFGVPGQYLSPVRSGQAASPLAVSARAAGSTDALSRGEISFLDNTVDVSTGTLKVKGTFANADRKLWPGEIVEVSLQLSVASRAVVVPASAVQNGQQGQYVYVVNPDRTVAFRPVQVSLRNGDDVVVTNGVKVGEEIVTDGQLGLTPGAKVQLKTGAAAGRGVRP